MTTGCTSINKSQRSSSINISVESNLDAHIYVDMSKKITGTAVEVRVLGITTQSSKYYADGVSYNGGGASLFGGITELAKAGAAYRAVRSQKDVDVIVAPQYVIKKKSFFPFYTKVVATVTGYPGKIRSIKKSRK
jgi:hypothetical protein